MLKAQPTKTLLIPASKAQGYWKQSPDFEEAADNLYRIMNHGTPDAKSEYDGMTGEVTALHIREGVCGSSQLCAVSLAVAEMFSVPPNRVEVDGESVGVYDADLNEIFSGSLSDALGNWIYDFDCERGVKPVNLIVKGTETGYLLDIL